MHRFRVTLVYIIHQSLWRCILFHCIYNLEALIAVQSNCIQTYFSIVIRVKYGFWFNKTQTEPLVSLKKATPGYKTFFSTCVVPDISYMLLKIAAWHRRGWQTKAAWNSFHEYCAAATGKAGRACDESCSHSNTPVWDDIAPSLAAHALDVDVNIIYMWVVMTSRL